MELWIGAPLVPPVPANEPASLAMVTDWHAAIMSEIARLSDKQWTARTKEANHDRA
jgi:hypothetical protein